MSELNGPALDRYITGNYGEDQFSNVMDRIDGLVNQTDFDNLKSSTTNITKDMRAEGFDDNDIQEFFDHVIKEVMGDNNGN